MASSYLSRFSSPTVKLVRFFEGSRDRWKAKQKRLRDERKLLLNQTRAVEKSREAWRERASAAEQRVKELERELAELKSSPRSACPR
jgi:chromosome segregation ATPase